MPPWARCQREEFGSRTGKESSLLEPVRPAISILWSRQVWVDITVLSKATRRSERVIWGISLSLDEGGAAYILGGLFKGWVFEGGGGCYSCP